MSVPKIATYQLGTQFQVTFTKPVFEHWVNSQNASQTIYMLTALTAPAPSRASLLEYRHGSLTLHAFPPLGIRSISHHFFAARTSHNTLRDLFFHLFRRLPASIHRLDNFFQRCQLIFDPEEVALRDAVRAPRIPRSSSLR